jgi:hypothetical protein
MRNVAQQIASELLPDLPIYFIAESDGAPDKCRLPDALATTGRTLDLLARPWLESRGEWRGRRPAIYLADRVIQRLADAEAGDDATRAADLARQLAAAIVCHEIGHVVESTPDYSEATPKKVEFATAIAAYSLVVDGSTALPPMRGHSAKFIRLSLHAAYRANKAGHAFDIGLLFFATDLGTAKK